MSISFEEILSEGNTEKLFEFCSKYDIPEDLRGKIWLNLLNIQFTKQQDFNENIFDDFIKNHQEDDTLIDLKDLKTLYEIIDKFENITKIEKYSLLETITQNYFYKFEHLE